MIFNSIIIFMTNENHNMNKTNKEKQRKKILSCNSSYIRDEDFSMFGDEDIDIFEKLVSFDSYKNNIYSTLSEVLKNNKRIVVQAAQCSFNIPLIPKHFFEDKDVIKSIIYNRSEHLIPVEYLTHDIINYMFVNSPRCSLSTEEIKKGCDKYLTKESIIKVLIHFNKFYSKSKKENAHPCLENLYIPEHFLEDKDIIKLLIIPQFNLVKDNDNITKEMIIELLDSGYILNKLPSKFLNDTDFIKKCLVYKNNYHFLDDYSIIKIIKESPQLNFELLEINSDVANVQTYPLFFESFKTIFSQDIKKMYLCSQIIDENREKLFNYMTSKEVLDLFEKKDKASTKKYDFSFLYKCYHYYLNPIVDNKFIIEEMAKQDKVLFRSISEEIVNDNEFMFNLLCKYKATVNFEDDPIEALLSKCSNKSEFEKYLQMLKLEYSLSHNLNKSSKRKI